MATKPAKHARPLPRPVFPVEELPHSTPSGIPELVNGINSGLFPTIDTGYQRPQPNSASTTRTSFPEWPRRTRAREVPVRDGRTRRRSEHDAIAAIGAIRGNAKRSNQIANLEQDSFSNDSGLNSEVSVLNKINAANVFTLRTLQDFEQTSGLAPRGANHRRKATAGGDHQRHQHRYRSSASVSRNIAQVTGRITDSLQNFRMP